LDKKRTVRSQKRLDQHLSKHLLIAGTGRAGTSFLVRYLARLGLETKLSQVDENAAWDHRANAGLEDLPLPLPDGKALPYVIKHPWTYQYVQELLDNPSLQLDAVIIPMRALAEAAASRCVLELEHMHSTLPWMSELAQTWEHFAHTSGGVVYSVNPLDEARLLAVGFHQLLDRLVKADIPVILLAFPRLIEDPDYLFRKLSPILPGTITAEFANAAHAGTADRAKVRIGKELDHMAPGGGLQTHGPAFTQLDRVALARLLTEARQNLANAEAELAVQRAARDLLAQRLAETETERAALQKARDGLAGDLVTARSRIPILAKVHARLSRQRAGRTAEPKNRLVAMNTIKISAPWRAAQRFKSLAARLPWSKTHMHRILRRFG